MPRSENRRQIEIPKHLYDELEAEAKAEGSSVTYVLQLYVDHGRMHRDTLSSLDTHVREVYRDTTALRRELEALRVAMENRLPAPELIPAGKGVKKGKAG
jgi:hypothetical protein